MILYDELVPYCIKVSAIDVDTQTVGILRTAIANQYFCALYVR